MGNVWGFIIAWTVLLVLIGIAVRKVQRNTLKVYQQCLSDLAGDPSNATLRARAINAGRKHYANNKYAVSDAETAIQNDLSTITRGM